MPEIKLQFDNLRDFERAIAVRPNEEQAAHAHVRSPSATKLFVAAALFCGTLLLMTVASGDSSSEHRRQKRQASCQVDMCLTEECIHASSSILKAMDSTVDPCEDFYAYACGGWIKENAHRAGVDELFYGVNHNVLPENIDVTLNEILKRNIVVDEELLYSKPYQDVFAFYDTCNEVSTEEGDMRPLLEVLSSLKHFQVNRPFQKESWNLTAAILELMRMNGVPLFDVAIDADIKNSSKYAIIVAPPRRYGLIPTLVGPRMPVRQRPGYEKILRSKGRKALFGDSMDDAVLSDMITEIRAQKRGRNVLQDAGNGFSSNEIAHNEEFTTKANVNDDSTRSASPQPRSQDTTTTTTTTTTATGDHPDEDSTIQYEYDDEDEDDNVVSRRAVYQVFKRNMEFKRIESLGKMLQDIVNNSTEEEIFVTLGSITAEDIWNSVIQDFISNLEKIEPDEYEEMEAQQHVKLYNYYTVSRLQQEVPMVDWDFLLRSLFNQTITDDDNIYVYYPDYLVSLNQLLSTTEPWVVHYGMLLLYSFDVLRETIYAESDVDRTDFCLQATKRAFGEALTNMYLHYVGKETINHIRKHSTSILNTLREEVINSVEHASWLNTQDKAAALDKLQNLHAEIGAYDKHWDLKFVSQSHIGVNLSQERSFRDNVLNIYQVLRTELYYLYKKPVDRHTFIWSFTAQPYIVNAFHMQSTNTIVLPEAFFHAPYYIKKGPEYLNYGSAATAMAHEIFHGLDLTGTLFDFRGEMTRPFSNASRDHLREVVQCYHNLLNDTFYEEVTAMGSSISMEIDINTTLNENLADIGGIRHSFRAYQEWEKTHYREPRLPALPLTPHQLFFVSTAQPYCAVIPNIAKILLMELDEHLPNGMRINAMMLNTPEFAEAFHCSKGSRMVANETCRIF